MVTQDTLGPLVELVKDKTKTEVTPSVLTFGHMDRCSFIPNFATYMRHGVAIASHFFSVEGVMRWFI